MLTIPLEKLAYIVTRAREFDADVPPVDDDSGPNPSDDAERDVLEFIDALQTPDNLTRQRHGLNSRRCSTAHQ